MRRVALLASVGAALALGATTAIAQVQQKGPDEKAGGQAQQKGQGAPGAEKAEPKEKGAVQGTDQTRKGAGQVEREGKGTAGKGAEPKGKAPKGTAEKGAEPRDKATKGSEPEKAPKGSAEKRVEPKERAAKGAAEKGSATGRVQLSEQQRTSVGQTVLKEQRVNRVTKPNFSINVGTRVPRSVRLVAMPVSVVSIVPAYRSYRYFVVDEQICIVDPATYEIVEIIAVSDQTARTDRASATLVLTEEEKAIILLEVDTSRGGSTLGLGALGEGADLPRGVELRVFPDTVVQQVPKVRNHKFFTVENRVAIVDPMGAKVQLVVGRQR
jgi:hypothetical protein